MKCYRCKTETPLEDIVYCTFEGHKLDTIEPRLCIGCFIEVYGSLLTKEEPDEFDRFLKFVIDKLDQSKPLRYTCVAEEVWNKAKEILALRRKKVIE